MTKHDFKSVDSVPNLTAPYKITKGTIRFPLSQAFPRN
jgi:hypothetical protein